MNFSMNKTFRNEILKGQLSKKQIDYWRTQLTNISGVHNLPLDHVRLADQIFTTGIHRRLLKEETCKQLNDFCQDNNSPIGIGLQAVFSVLIARYCNETDIVMGSPAVMTNRDKEVELDSLHTNKLHASSLLTNIVALRNNLADNPSFSELLSQSKEMFMAAHVIGQHAVEEVTDKLDMGTSVNFNSLFQVMITFDEPLQQEVFCDYDICLNISENESGLCLDWLYNAKLFDAATIIRLVDHFELLLIGLSRSPYTNVFSVDMLSKGELHQQLVEWNDTAADYPKDTCIHELLEQQVKLNPERIALVCDNKSLTYNELNVRANRLARYLVEDKQVKFDTLVGICVERSMEMLVGIFAILKAGGAYMPMEPAYPEARLSYLLSDAGLTTVLTQEHLRKCTPVSENQAVYLDDPVFLQDLQQYSPEDLRLSISVEQLAYVIYTSGSTGQPKGVMVEHHSVANLAFNLKSMDLCSTTTSDKNWGWLAPFTSDASIQGISQLALGQRLTIISEACKRDLESLMKILPKLSVIDCSPAMVEIWFDAGIEAQLPNLIIGGEAISQKLWTELVRWQSEQGKKAINVYGPTECTVNSTQCLISGDKPHIGMSLANTRAYVLDRDLGLAPIGIFGELYIGGGGLARGYLNKPELTAASFIHDPYYDGQQPENRRLYKTGDLVRRLADGNLEFLGRNDHQIKINGFRIEPGEIAHVLVSQEGVNNAVVVAKTGFTGDGQLVAYVVVDNTDIILGDDDQSRNLRNKAITSLREVVKLILPEYMVPSAFVLLAELPLNPNGKLNRDALPEPDIQALIQDQYVAPSNDTEEKLCLIWQKLLGIGQVGITDNFFDMGGNSLSATKMSNIINLEFGVRVKLKDIFEVRTIDKISEIIVHLLATGSEDNQQRVFKFHQDDAFDMESFEL